MEFWGTEIPSGKPLHCDPGDVSYIHISQAALGESKSGEGNERVVLKVKVNDKEIVFCTLSHGKCDQAILDLIFEQEFTISHNGSTSVYLAGYKTDAVHAEEDFSDEDDLSDKGDVPKPTDISIKDNGKQRVVKTIAVADKSAVKSRDTLKSGKIKVNAKSDDGNKAKNLVAKWKILEGKGKEKVEKKEEDESSDEDEKDEDGDSIDSESEPEEELREQPGIRDLSKDEMPIASKKRPLSSLQIQSATKKKKTKISKGNVNQGTKQVWIRSPITTRSMKPISKEQRKASVKENKTKPATSNSEQKIPQFTCQACNKNFASKEACNQHKRAKRH